MLRNILSSLELELAYEHLIKIDDQLTSLGYVTHHNGYSAATTNLTTAKASDVIESIEHVLLIALEDVLAKLNIITTDYITIFESSQLIEAIVTYMDDISKHDEEMDLSDMISAALIANHSDPLIIDKLSYIGDFTALLPKTDEGLPIESEPEPEVEPDPKSIYMDKLRDLKPPVITQFIKEGGKVGYSHDLYLTMITDHYLECDVVNTRDLAADITIMGLISRDLRNSMAFDIEEYMTAVLELDLDQQREVLTFQI